MAHGSANESNDAWASAADKCGLRCWAPLMACGSILAFVPMLAGDELCGPSDRHGHTDTGECT